MRLILQNILVISIACLVGLTPLPASSAWKPSHLFHHAFWARLSDRFVLTGLSSNVPAVQEKVQQLSHNKSYLIHLTRNAEPYIYYVAQETKRRKIPAEIALLPMIESNYDPFLYSRRGATGLWQIMPGTASGFGLEINWWYDGRRDIVASTHAALNYLEYLHHYFHDWLLAIAAYDAGEGNVLAAIRRNRKQNKPTDFWSLPLPNETKHYIPKLLALAELIQHHKRYNLTLVPVANKPYFTSVTLNKSLSFAQIAELANTTTQEIQTLNPGFRRGKVVRDNAYECLIPIEKASTFKAALEKSTLQATQFSNLTRYKVKPGDTLERIARRYHTSTFALKQTNHLTSDVIRINQTLWIPEQTHEKKSMLRKSISEDNLPGPRHITHHVKANETLSGIAHHYHVSMRQICFWNGLTPRSKLHLNQKLTIWKPHHIRAIHYTVKSGDSLGKIAEHFGSSVIAIRRENHLKSTVIRIGQHLTIPASDS